MLVRRIVLMSTLRECGSDAGSGALRPGSPAICVRTATRIASLTCVHRADTAARSGGASPSSSAVNARSGSATPAQDAGNSSFGTGPSCLRCDRPPKTSFGPPLSGFLFERQSPRSAGGLTVRDPRPLRGCGSNAAPIPVGAVSRIAAAGFGTVRVRRHPQSRRVLPLPRAFRTSLSSRRWPPAMALV